MKDDKKKLAIVGVLGFIVVGVGAFQFLGGGGGAPAKPKPATKPTVAADAKDDSKLKNPEYAVALAPRDPFKAPAGLVPPDPKDKSAKPAANATQPPHLRGNLGGGQALPNALGGGSVAPLQLAPAEPVFGYRLSGLISGHHPAAVFTDSSGAQRLVPLNGSLDGDTQLLAVQKGRVVVSFKGKHLSMSLGGTPNAN